MKMYNDMMMSLIKMRTQYVDMQHEALRNNDNEAYNHYQLRINKIEELMEKVRDNMMKW